MKNLIPYNGDYFEVHKKAVESKNESDLKERLKKLYPVIETDFAKYSKEFENNNLSSIRVNSILIHSRDDLFSLYEYKSKVIRELRKGIRKLQIKTIISTCQNCTLNSINTLDHILPKSKFPEFVVNPINLFPCCSSCNSYKNSESDNGIGQRFLNLYLDRLPEEQYLFLDVFKDSKDELDFNFRLENVGGKISSSLFSIINSHYEKLRLFDGFKLKSIEYLSELRSKISSFKTELPIETIVRVLEDSIKKDKLAYGFNHWKCILELSLIKSEIFLETVE